MFQINFASRIPIYEQIFSNVVQLVSAGVIKPGDKLPPVRVLAQQIGINPNTVAKAYRELESSGYIYSTVGRGSFVSDMLSEAAAHKAKALDDFKSSVNNAHLYGVTEEEMISYIKTLYGGGNKVD